MTARTSKTTTASKTVASKTVASKPAAKEETAQSAPAEQPKEWVVNGHKFSEDTAIKFRSNPKRANSQAWTRYETYQTAETFGEYLKLNSGKAQMADARHDFGKGFLTVVDTAETK